MVEMTALTMAHSKVVMTALSSEHQTALMKVVTKVVMTALSSEHQKALMRVVTKVEMMAHSTSKAPKRARWLDCHSTTGLRKAQRMAGQIWMGPNSVQLMVFRMAFWKGFCFHLVEEMEVELDLLNRKA